MKDDLFLVLSFLRLLCHSPLRMDFSVALKILKYIYTYIHEVNDETNRNINKLFSTYIYIYIESLTEKETSEIY